MLSDKVIDAEAKVLRLPGLPRTAQGVFLDIGSCILSTTPFPLQSESRQLVLVIRILVPPVLPDGPPSGGWKTVVLSK